MPPRGPAPAAPGLSSSAFMKPFVVLALPGMYLFYKYSQYRRQQQEQNRRKVTERELQHLNHKIDKLLTKLEENEPEMATSQEDECVICVNAKATMQTSPCGHRVVCRKCFVKTIQMAVSQRLLPLRCVICRAKILRLKQSGGGGGGGSGSLHHHHHHHHHPHHPQQQPQHQQQQHPAAYGAGLPWGVMPSSASQYSVGSSVPNSESLYSMTSGSSSLSGVSSVSSATTSSAGSSGSGGGGLGKAGKAGAAGAAVAVAAAARVGLGFPRQPTGSLRRSQAHSMKLRLQDYKEPAARPVREPEHRLPPIKEFQREFRACKERTASSSSTRIRCAQKIVTQLETTPVNRTSKSSYFRSPLKPANKEDKRRSEKWKDERKKEDRKDNEENLENKKKEEKMNKKAEKKEAKLEKKADKKEEKKEAKAEKKEKTEKKENKKEAKAEAKESKKAAKAEKKKEKSKTEKKEKD
ncbi:fl(2)d-associated complex component [Schistocerca americana]|uniref:fl(2)d-associated complex component n=1 Tax=Schistocerca americana TaxID=7009 RepID=UPI001F4FD4A3|nr:fl(2)d-associated complex component [Schistocerca americana]